MAMKNDTALVDNDFLDHVSEINRPQAEATQIIKKALAGLGVDVVMHPCVFHYELMETPLKKALFNEKIIKKLSFDEILLGDPDRKTYYSFLILELYNKLTGNKLDTGDKDVFTYWKRGASLGEVHSMTTCLICGYGLFLSDDRDSKILKNLIEQDYSESITVYNRSDVISNIPADVLKRNEARAFSHKAK